MNTIKTTVASVLGGRHARAARNGQDAAASWSGTVSDCSSVVGIMGSDPISVGSSGSLGSCSRAGNARRANGEEGSDPISAAVVVVCDGCSSGASSEVGARLGTKLFACAVGARIEAGESPCDPAMWADARAEVVAQFGALADQMARGACISTARGACISTAVSDVVGVASDARGDELGAFTDVVREHFLFTVVAAAVRGDEAAVWALGDGVYSFGDYTRQLGPFADNAPPYLGYDLLGDARPAHFEVVSLSRGVRGASVEAIIVGTDGAAEIIGGVERFAGRRYVEHADALRRELAMLAKPQERIDWEAQRVVRAPAMLQDDCAIGVLRFERPAIATNLVVVEASS